MTSMNEAMKQKGFVSASEAAEMSGVSIYTIYNWLNADKVVGKKIAEHWYVNRESLIAHVGQDAIDAVSSAHLSNTSRG